jgi:hypothetical protein
MAIYSTGYLIERLERAVRTLVVEFEDPRTRLNHAVAHLLVLPPSEFPVHLQVMRAEIASKLERFDGREGHITYDNIRKMRKADVSEVCELIFDLYLGLLEHRPK